MDLQSLNKNLVKENLLGGIVYLDEVDSTNKYASRNFGNLTDNTLILTEYQTTGKGRFERNWESPKGENLMFTLLKKVRIDIDKIQNVIFYTSYILFLTLKEMLDDASGKKLLLKWPNDVLLNRKKVAGILLEVKDLKQAVKGFIIGIGLNVNQKEFQVASNKSAVSLNIETGKKYSRELILEKFILNFYGNSDMISQSERLLDLWKMNSFGMNEKIYFRQYDDEKDKAGIIKSIDNDGGILICFEDGIQKKFYSGEIRILY